MVNPGDKTMRFTQFVFSLKKMMLDFNLYIAALADGKLSRVKKKAVSNREFVEHDLGDENIMIHGEAPFGIVQNDPCNLFG